MADEIFEKLQNKKKIEDTKSRRITLTYSKRKKKKKGCCGGSKTKRGEY